MSKPKIIVILGPTASGKSDLAVQLAKKFKGEVISTDSRQVYKDLDIGTGKITKKEMWGVPHHLLDVANPHKQFTASDFVSLTNKAVVQIVNKEKIPILCGGTGFYIDALLGEKQIPEVPPDLELRKKLEKKTVAELFKILQKLDPMRASNIDSKNPRRLVRAIEICNTLGKVPSVQNLNYKSEIRNRYEVLKIGVKIDEEELRKKINKRLEKRIKSGMIQEAKKLHKKGLSYKRMRELGLEYRALADLLEEKTTRGTLVGILQKEIWHYAKRQMTYFKKDKTIVWLEPKFNLLQKEVKKFLR